MRVNVGSAAPLVAIALFLASRTVVAQPQVGATELARAKTLLELSRAELTAKQFALLSRKLAAAESAYAEFSAVARAGRAAVALTEGSAATSASTGARATTTGGRTLLGGAAELLPFLLLIWPSTAHAPGIKQETPEMRTARSKLEESLKELAQAARQVESEKAASSSVGARLAPQVSVRDAPPQGAQDLRPSKEPRKRKTCLCICGDPHGPITERKSVGYMREDECRSSCVWDHRFPEGMYSCQ